MHSQSPSTTNSPPATSSRRLSVGTKSRTCVHCGRSFRRTEHLERHVRTHTKEKPYTCYCGAAFSRRDLLKRHMTIAGHEETNPPTKSSPKSQAQIDRENTKQRVRRASKSQRASAVSGPLPVQKIAIPPSPEEGTEIVQWTMQQPFDNVLESPSTDGAHDPEILEAAQLLLPGSLPQNYPPTHPSPPPTLTYLPEEFNHFEDVTVTNFLDSLGIPLEWSNGAHHGNDAHAHNNNSYPAEVPETALHPFFRERDRSRAESSWHLPPDQSAYAGIGMVSDYASNVYHYHPPEDLAGRCA
ncbi:hypothetical protein BJX68DRAFT_59280 [Aspergillus pseudodeflectus]|uniref:C2H2-type domain-containing protein n=1 Tax=Aspergillus pseudodeflectus TaxID=176178 RepID=A0ABR4KIL4_9EURO